ncbi:Wzz/FepE/Etk N-terminal domain-containing protein [Corynebacterium pilosum]|uniref:Capsular polysaccharide biosynthesis protein n=1 Tax=Corynebacterium pilosum TaxID=35756 RepID=A0A376CK27_9CORY|nr:Wzz/FepE/Etk N-terminal domain-containing protein [Corynebacterium pilosum]STC68774.1 Capsular polysaccharide biosynthesis protein [Corynebacterium pilosum]
MQTENYIENASLGFDQVGRILRRRKAWIAVGIVVGMLVAIGVILFMPKQYTATTHVHVTPVGAGASSDSLDMSTERQLAESAKTAVAAAQALGGGWSSEKLLENTRVGGDSESTILRISFTGKTPQRAATGSMAMAEAYLQVGSDAVAMRNENLMRSLDEQIIQQEGALETLQMAAAMGGTPEAVQAESLRRAIADLQQRRIELSSSAGPTGEIVTSAEANRIDTSPSTLRTLALGLVGGLALGVLLALIVQATARRPADSSEIEQLLGVPVFRPAAPEGDSDRWSLASEFARHAAGDGGRIRLLIDDHDSTSIDAANAIASSLDADINGLRASWSESIHAAGTADSVLVIIPREWTKAALQRLRDDLSHVDAHVIGAVVSDAPVDQTVS